MTRQIEKVLALMVTATVVGAMFVGCGSSAGQAAGKESATLSEEAAPTSASEEKVGAPYFTKGVYANYSSELDNPTKDYFYVFYDEGAGYTDDGVSGLPFSCTQEDGKITFSFGGEGEAEEVLVVTEVKDDLVYAYFEGAEDRPLVFELMADADPDNFSAENYLGNGTDNVYNDANGWRVHYNPSCIEVNTQGNITTFVYTGDCAGTCMVSVTYDVDKNAKEVSEDLAKQYGDSASVSEGIFPGTEDEKGYWITSSSDGNDSGLYMTGIVRDYMEGYLLFENIMHMGGDEEMDMAASDSLATIIDSLQFSTNEN
ncbi:hypothetical protein [Pseudobutyrivibrio xylanivorans]|uniref:Uncharacterized protein n=1 Tax=Pseudobutyrivibrio xylanivorans TaxID=185007 RepID=A0A5P6VVZ2_PSEXY|nr:hypothetical protein [Pseudobutyrivibrio xylanivorans]QFJ56044.1 hypothetical protein FXF36_14715 [Pseudobutyrivibrio xylanivorans]